jgi:hypothetical protein
MPISARTTPWEPLYQDTLLIGPLVENCIALVKRDMEEAIAWAAQSYATALSRPVLSLPKFKSVENSDTLQTKFPWAIIEPSTSAIAEHPNGEGQAEGHKIDIEFAHTGRDAQSLTLAIEIYALAMHMMLMSASASDLLAGYGPCADISWEVSDHEYSRSSKDDSGFLRAAKMTLTMKFSEVKS